MAKKFLFVSLGILALAAAYQLGATRTEAQQGGVTFAGISVDANVPITTAITTGGDVYARGAFPNCDGSWFGPGCDSGWHQLGNVLDGPINVEDKTWGSINGNFK
jgi:hypothetical protein